MLFPDLHSILYSGYKKCPDQIRSGKKNPTFKWISCEPGCLLRDELCLSSRSWSWSVAGYWRTRGITLTKPNISGWKLRNNLSKADWFHAVIDWIKIVWFAWAEGALVGRGVLGACLLSGLPTSWFLATTSFSRSPPFCCSSSLKISLS